MVMPREYPFLGHSPYATHRSKATRLCKTRPQTQIRYSARYAKQVSEWSNRGDKTLLIVPSKRRYIPSVREMRYTIVVYGEEILHYDTDLLCE